MSDNFVSWFRGASPYINAHRGQTFVVQFSGEAVRAYKFAHLIHDIALLNSLGVRLVVVYGIRPQIEQRLTAIGHTDNSFHSHLRITDSESLEVAKDAAGSVRHDIEALFSMGLANSPMAGAGIRVAGGNFITARPIGVRDGVDYSHTGEVRRIDVAAMEQQLEGGAIVLIPPIGYSPTGEQFNLGAEELATALALELCAAKLLLIGEGAGLRSEEGGLIRQYTVNEAQERLKQLQRCAESDDDEAVRQLAGAIHACTNGVRRTHLLDRHIDGVLLLELFTRDGIGTLISVDPFEHVRQAGIEDVGGILALIEPLEQEGILVRRPREMLEQEIDRFTVVERDGAVIACVAMYPTQDQSSVELVCLAVHRDYRNAGLGEILLRRVEHDAKALGAGQLFVLTTHTAHWFRERGFDYLDIEKLPVERKAVYNYQRNSKVLIKPLEK